ncbi:MAG: hypothetical protein OXJ38_08295 [Gammaproteobacteria bacterium]|nr:hypothetical protein [Gammaproteobacteria bacterium]
MQQSVEQSQTSMKQVDFSARYRDKNNIVPIPYRKTSVQKYAGEMSEKAVQSYLLGKEAYRRTEFIVLKGDNQENAVVAIQKSDDQSLFSDITHVEILGLPENCIYVQDSSVDCANRSALAEAAFRNQVKKNEICIVEGKYDHINFICRPDPLVLQVLEVEPPSPPKLYDMVVQALSYADLPPILVEFKAIDVRELCNSVDPECYLLPCRSGGMDQLQKPVYFLDERPKQRKNWVLIGCERSLQFHRHYYGDEPPQVEMCPRKLRQESGVPTLLKCCLLEFEIERDGDLMVVPWGADLTMVEQALREISGEVEYV